MLSQPTRVGDVYLSAYLGTLRMEGYTIFEVVGGCPPPAQSGGEYGLRMPSWGAETSWHSISDLVSNANGGGNGASAANPFPGVGNRLVSGGGGSGSGQDDDLARAIAASLGGNSNSNSGGDGMDAALAQALAMSRNDGKMGSMDENCNDMEDDDSALQRAIAMSMQGGGGGGSSTNRWMAIAAKVTESTSSSGGSGGSGVSGGGISSSGSSRRTRQSSSSTSSSSTNSSSKIDTSTTIYPYKEDESQKKSDPGKEKGVARALIGSGHLFDPATHHRDTPLPNLMAMMIEIFETMYELDEDGQLKDPDRMASFTRFGMSDQTRNFAAGMSTWRERLKYIFGYEGTKDVGYSDAFNAKRRKKYQAK